MTQHINPAVFEDSITANSQYKGPFQFRPQGQDRRQDSQRVSISGTFSGTIDVILCDPGSDQTSSANAVVLGTYSAPTSQNMFLGGACDVYFHSTAWTSGTANCRIYF